MTSAAIANLLKLLDAGRDNALLRYSLGNEFLKSGDYPAAVEHLRVALKHDADYSAAWKLLGRALEMTGALHEALDAFRQGVAVAERKGDKQAAREMIVFARRIERQSAERLPNAE